MHDSVVNAALLDDFVNAVGNIDQLQSIVCDPIDNPVEDPESDLRSRLRSGLIDDFQVDCILHLILLERGYIQDFIKPFNDYSKPDAPSRMQFQLRRDHRLAIPRCYARVCYPEAMPISARNQLVGKIAEI